jgi:hypothetical protein
LSYHWRHASESTACDALAVVTSPVAPAGVGQTNLGEYLKPVIPVLPSVSLTLSPLFTPHTFYLQNKQQPSYLNIFSNSHPP